MTHRFFICNDLSSANFLDNVVETVQVHLHLGEHGPGLQLNALRAKVAFEGIEKQRVALAALKQLMRALAPRVKVEGVLVDGARRFPNVGGPNHADAVLLS